MSDIGVRNLERAIVGIVIDHFSILRDQARMEHFGSPIEWLFYLSCKMRARYAEEYPIFSVGLRQTDTDREVGGYDLILFPQQNILDARVDFLAVFYDQGKRYQAIIECDGHDFHERTKEQAARDRSRDRLFQQAGYIVLRFTGSEIVNDPWACAQELWAWSQKIQDANRKSTEGRE